MQISPGLLLLVLQSGPELKAIGHPNAIHSEWGLQALGTVLGLVARGPFATGRLSPCISKVQFEDVKMKTIRGHVEQPVHEAYHLGPPPVLPGSFSQLPEDNEGCNTLPEMAEVTKEGKLDVRHVLHLRLQSPDTCRRPNLTAIGHSGQNHRELSTVMDNLLIGFAFHGAQLALSAIQALISAKQFTTSIQPARRLRTDLCSCPEPH